MTKIIPFPCHANRLPAELHFSGPGFARPVPYERIDFRLPEPGEYYVSTMLANMAIKCAVRDPKLRRAVLIVQPKQESNHA